MTSEFFFGSKKHVKSSAKDTHLTHLNSLSSTYSFSNNYLDSV